VVQQQQPRRAQRAEHWTVLSRSKFIHPNKRRLIEKKTHIVSDILSKPTKGFLIVNRKHIPIFLFHLLFLFKESDKFFHFVIGSSFICVVIHGMKMRAFSYMDDKT
jgi:hypothetical protein